MLCDVTARTSLPASGGSAAATGYVVVCPLVTRLKIGTPPHTQIIPRRLVCAGGRDSARARFRPSIVSPRIPTRESECGSRRAAYMR